MQQSERHSASSARPLLGGPHRAARAALTCQRLRAAMFFGLPLCKRIGKGLISRVAVKNDNVSGEKKGDSQGEMTEQSPPSNTADVYSMHCRRLSF